MSTPLDNLEFETVKQLRKSLLITSVIGIALSFMIEYSTGCISLFGFTFENEKSMIITKLIGCIVIYFLASFLIKYRNDELPNLYQKKVSILLDDWHGNGLYSREQHIEREIRENVRKAMKYRFEINVILMRIKDIFFPITLGLCSIFICFCGVIDII